MILLFEEYHYPKQLLKDVLKGYEYLCTELKNGESKVQYVGYFFSTKHNDSVFILPKVFIDNKSSESKAFGRYNPEDIIYIGTQDEETNQELIAEGDNNIIFELSVWIYRAITQFVNRHTDNDIVEESIIQNPVEANGEKSQTLLDTILQLMEFHKKHRNLFTYISIINASGNNKIHWAKTISKTQPIVKDNNPYYVEFKNKSKVVNFDEELIVLFYSTLEYLCDTYNFRIKSDVQYNLLSSQKIKDLIETERGTRLLKKIRRKYFTDELVKLWKLLYAFFDRAERIKSHKNHEDRLLVKNFNIVFEDMIDYLIGSKQEDIPDELKNQADGKIVDHIYREESLIDDGSIYFVGDSKYYSSGNVVGKNSIYKQFTYAKNIIQYNINLLNDEAEGKNIKYPYFRYRDEITEGYNITPNFFIRGVINPDNISYEEEIRTTNGILQLNKHFFNRLFDRDTLILKEYDINFLYVLSVYAINIESNNRTHRLRTKFRNDLLVALDSAYSFYKVKPKNTSASLEDVVRNYFYDFNGRMYISQNDSVIWVALEKDKEHGVEGDKRYPSISSFEAMCVVSERLELCERDSEYGCKEKYFGEPIWNKPIGYTVALNEGGIMAAEDLSAYNTNLNN
jgi:hypothetical protein